MGLDQYIYKEKKEEQGEDEQIHYWRKNYQLNDWACWNFCPDGIADFNCKKLFLHEFMIDEILEHIIYNLEKADESEDGLEGICSQNTLEAFKDCKERIKKGEVLYYYAWW